MRLLSLPLLLTVGFAVAALGASDRSVGAPNAPVTVDLYSDFQCPHCALLHFGALKQALSDCVASGKVRIVYHDFPLPQHAFARKAAQYADAAAEIGRYERVCDVIFRNQDSWAVTGDVEKFVAQELSPAEMGRLKKILADPRAMAEINKQIDADLATGQRIPVQSTPTMVMTGGGKRYPITGDVRYDLLRQLIGTIVK